MMSDSLEGPPPKPAPILIDNEKEWKVDTILHYMTRPGRGQFLVKWKGYPNSENSRKLVKGLENTEDLVQAWWTDTMLGDEFPTVFSGYIAVCFTPTNNGYQSILSSWWRTGVSGNLSCTLITIAMRFWFLFCILEMLFSFCLRCVTGMGYWLVSSII